MKPHATQVLAPVTLPSRDEIGQLARLAFASRAGEDVPLDARPLSFLPPDALDMDLSDPIQRDFGEYELLEKIGQGGMGVVYRARQHALDREVALKLLAAGPWASREFIQRFRREAQSAARLEHPNIVAVYESGVQHELHFFSMRLVRGESLAALVARDGPRAPREAARLLLRIAEALDYAHRLGVLHLDLKPGNVLIDEAGEPLVADFGLARRIDQALADEGEDVSGTPSYMAPEQAMAHSLQIGRRTDIYGLGAILYEALTGQPPFLGATPQQTLERVVSLAPVAPRTHCPEIPVDLDAICLTCLEKEPERRYASAAVLADDLRRFLEDRAVSVRRPTRCERLWRWMRREPRVAVASAAALTALIAGLAATSMQWRRAEAQFLRAEQGAAQARTTLWRARLDDATALLRQGKDLDALPALVQNLAEQEAAGLHEAAELSRLRIGGVLAAAPVLVDSIAVGARIDSALLDPAGQWVVVTTGWGGAMRRFDLSTGTERWAIAGDVFKSQVRLVPASDGRHLLAETINPGVPVTRGIGSFLIDLDSGTVHKPPESRFPRLYNTHFSPDAAYALVVTRSEAGGGDPQGRLVRVANWQVQGADRSLPGLMLLGPGGHWFAYYAGLFSDDQVASPVEIFDARSMQRLWQYQPASGAALRTWRFAPDGQLALGFTDGEVSLFDPANGTRRRLPSTVMAGVDDLYFSADGQWIAASSVDGSVQVWDTTSAMAVAPPLHLSPEQKDELGEIGLDPARRHLYTSESDRARLWYLPGPQHAAELVFERPAYVRSISNLANAAALEQGLFAAGAADGELRVWRHRPSTPLPARAPLREMRDAQRQFDGRHVLHVEGRHAQLKGLGATPDGALLDFPQAVGFAQALPGADFVLASAGRELHLRHGLDGTPRYPPLLLPATPSALLASPDGRRVIAAWQAHDGKASTLALRSIDAASGSTQAESSLDHPAYALQLSDDGASVIAWRQEQLVLLDAARLTPRWEPRGFTEKSDYDRVRGVRLGRDGRTLWVVTGAGAKDGYRLHALDAASGKTAEVWKLPAWAQALQPHDHGEAVAVLIPSVGELRLFRRGGEVRVLKVAGLDGWTYPGLALSEDERRLAIGLKRGIQWLELPTGDWLGPPRQPSDSGVEFAGVALDPSGSVALMRDSKRRQWRYDLVREARSVPDLQALVHVLMPVDEDLSEVFSPPRDPALRAALRAADPGPPTAIRTTTTAGPAPDAMEPRFVDLRPHCTLELDDHPNGTHLQLRLDRVLAPGRQRLLGIDFDVRCGVAARYKPDAAANVTAGSRVEGIAVGQPEVAAVELLLLASTMLKDRALEDFAVIEFAYRDGSSARISLTYERDLAAWFDPDFDGHLRALRVAHVGLGAQYSDAGSATVAPALYARRVANPHPERAVASLALESTRHPWSEPMLLAATLEPVSAQPTGEAR